MKHTKSYKYTFLLVCFALFFACSEDEHVSSPTAIVTQPFSGDMGDFYQGGIVFFIDTTGEHGLIASPVDHTSKLPWGCYDQALSAPDGEPSKPIGKGADNTEDFMRFCFDNIGTAGEYCSNLSLNGYDDWFLPSLNELTLMHQNKSLINSTALKNGGNIFMEASYWSSSGVDPSEYAYIFLFDGADLSSERKDSLNYVRAARAF